MNIVGERIKSLRNEAKLSKVKLAAAIGVSDMAICRWERGDRIPDAEVIIKLAKFFNVSADYILGIIDY